jgi:two-component system phosphate regulon sensor histidine kinase PhoR
VSLGLREKLFALSVVFVGSGVLSADAYLTPVVARHLTGIIRNDGAVRARLCAHAAATFAAPLSDYAAWDELADSLGRETHAHVTLIGRDGTVLGDSEVSVIDVPRMENQASRPEVRDALNAEPTVLADETAFPRSRDMTELDVASVFERGGEVAGVARVIESMGEVDAGTADVRRILWLGAAVALAAALALSVLFAKHVSSAARELSRAARRMIDGDLSVRTHLPGGDEFAELGHTLDRLAGGLATTLGDLRAERDLQKNILEAMHEGVVVVDRDGKIALVNSALRSMLLLGADAVGKLLIETVRHAQLNTMLENTRASLDDRPVEIDLPGLKPRRVLVQVAPFSGGDGGVLFVFVDVTELRRLESLRRDFVANASHELRTPIAAVRSATETLRWGALDDRDAAIRFLDIIERNAQRLQSLVEDMLELSKLESNEFKLKRERVELQRVIPIVLALFRERAEKKGVRLFADLPAALPPVDGDPRALEHVLSNLVDNAVKYCPPGARILVGASADDDRVRLVVSDTGPGIAPEHLPRVFERFYRIDAGRSRELGGTGLGLSIVKHMVEAMRGKVSVDSAVGHGSTFSVALPRADFVAPSPALTG